MDYVEIVNRPFANYINRHGGGMINVKKIQRTSVQIEISRNED